MFYPFPDVSVSLNNCFQVTMSFTYYIQRNKQRIWWKSCISKSTNNYCFYYHSHCDDKAH